MRFTLPFIISLSFICSLNSYAQEPVEKQSKYLTIGSAKGGICFGNSIVYNGLRFNLRDRQTRQLNGINIHLLAKAHSFYFDADSTIWANAYNRGLNLGIINTAAVRSVGISTGLLVNGDGYTKGFSFAGLINTAGVLRKGITFGGLTVRSKRIKGLSISGIWTHGEDLSGLFLAGWSISSSNTAQIRNFKGLGIAGILVEAQKIKGLAIASIGVAAYEMQGVGIASINNVGEMKGIQIGLYNNAKKMRGIQFGLLNRIQSNPRWARLLPLVNFRFRKLEESNS